MPPEHQSLLRGLFEEGLIDHPVSGRSFCSATALLSSGAAQAVSAMKLRWRGLTIGSILAYFKEMFIFSRICFLMKHRNRYISSFSKTCLLIYLPWVLVVALRIFLYNIYVKINKYLEHVSH